MNDVFVAIMDAAERRMRSGGFNGFSFRDIADDVGVKSSSVHYHFPTKDALVAEAYRSFNNELVGSLAHYLFVGRTLAWDVEFEKKVMALDAAQIRAALQRHLVPSKFTIVKAGDFAGAAKQK